MTDLVPYKPPERDTVDGWSVMLPAVADLAQRIANTELVPAALRGKPAAVAAAVLAGREMHIGPMASLMHVHVVDGRPALSAEMSRALVQAAGHRIHFAEMTTTRCVVQGRRRGEEDVTTVTWTMDDARRAGLEGRTNWRRYPRRMLAARATGELCRLLFADCLAGMPYVVEEVEDDSDDVAAVGATTAEPPRRTAQRKTRPAAAIRVDEPPPAVPPPAAEPVDGPPLPGEKGYETDEPAAAEPTPMVTAAQLRKLHAVFTGHGVRDRDEVLTICGQIVDRDIATTKDISRDEAKAVIDTLERIAATGQDFTQFLADLIAAGDPDLQVEQPALTEETP